MIGRSLRHTLLAIALPLVTSIAAVGIIFAPFFFQRNLQELEWQSTARRKLIGPNGRIKTALFSPDDGIRDVLLGLISSETHRIIIASYVITDRIVVEELIKSHKRGIKIEVIVCRSGAQDQWTKVGLLIEAGIPVYVYPSAFIRSLMHNKFVVFFRSLERTLFATGSYNMTTSAGKANQENFLFMDDIELARQYIARFEHIKQMSVLVNKTTNIPSTRGILLRKRRVYHKKCPLRA